jgi:hypothetical protein
MFEPQCTEWKIRGENPHDVLDLSDILNDKTSMGKIRDLNVIIVFPVRNVENCLIGRAHRDCIFLPCVDLPLTSLRQRDIPPAQCVFHANLAFVLLVQICVI